MNNLTYEIFLGGGEVGAAKWRLFLRAVGKYLKFGDTWKIFITLDGVTLHYYLVTSRPLPSSFGLADFLLKKSPALPDESSLHPGTLRFYHSGDDCLDILRRLASRGRDFHHIVIDFRSYRQKYTSSAYLVYHYNQKSYLERLAGAHPADILAIDFAKNKNFAFKKFPKYLKSEKILKLLQDQPDGTLFEVDNFPYHEQKQFLGQPAYDFEKHSMVLGGSGSGKSKFLASFINQVYQRASDQYKIVVIDPHDSLKHDCQQISNRQVVDFCDVQNSVDLFQNNTEDANVSVELTLTLFRSLMGQDYNTQLERVLRFASYLLMSTGQFSFLRLRRLLTDLEFCNKIVKQYSDQLPDAVTRFFLADFNELRTKSYPVAIAPIIAFIDEMQMVPVFNQDANLPGIADNIRNNFLSIYSLSRPKLGNKVVQTIAGLLLQQLFLFAQRQSLNEHLIVVIDEVATVENPILARFLSELRKYRTSLILAGQYFDQFSPELREAIFANSSNYYIFRVSKRDAELLAQNLNIKLAGSDKIEDQQALLISLKDRECLVQISKNGESYPACKARTLDFAPLATSPAPPPESVTVTSLPAASLPTALSVADIPDPTKFIPEAAKSASDTAEPAAEPAKSTPHGFTFSISSPTKPEDVMSATSASRKIIKEKNA